MGCGKSFPALKYIEENLDKKILLVSSRLEAIHQFQKYIQEYIFENRNSSIRKQLPNFRAVTYQKVTLSTHICDLHPDVIISDEIHRMGGEEWETAMDELFSIFPDAKVIGMSATPERTDKRNMAYEKFDSIVYEMSLTEALSGEKEELLVSLKRLEEIAENAPSLPDIMVDALQKKNGKYYVFCANRQDMFEKMDVAQEIFGKVNSNIQIDYIISRDKGTGKSKAENRRTIEEFERREEGDALNLLFCVDMLNVGIHLKGISGEVILRPIGTAIEYKQLIGRVLTSEEQTVIVDAKNNWIRQAGTFQELQQATLRGTRVSEKKAL